MVHKFHKIPFHIFLIRDLKFKTTKINSTLKSKRNGYTIQKGPHNEKLEIFKYIGLYTVYAIKKKKMKRRFERRKQKSSSHFLGAIN